MNRTVLFSALWIASLALVFLLGRSAAPEPPAPPAAEPPSASGERVVHTVEFVPRAMTAFDEDDDHSIQVDRAFDPGEPPESAYAGRPNITPAEIESLLPAALNSDDRITQNLVVAHMLSQLTAGNAATMLSAFETSERNWMTDQHFRMFMHAWGRVDGEAAANYAWLNKDGRKVSYAGTWALSAWAEQDPARAFDFMEEQDQGLAQKMHDGFLRGYARANLDEASGYVASLEKGKMRGAAVETLVREHMRQGGRDGTLDWATQTLHSGADESYVKYVLGKATMQAAKDDGVALARWVDQHRASEHITPQMFEEAADEWAESDPSAAMAWLERHMDDKRVTSEVIDEVTDEWAKTDPTRAAAWIEDNLDSPLMNGVVSGRAAGEWAVNDPQAAAEWVASLPQNMQGKSNLYVARQWPHDQLDEAVKWIDSSRATQLDPAREAVADRIDRQDPAEAIRISNSIRDPKTRERALVRSAQAMTRQNRDAVVAWLPVSGLSAQAQHQVLHPKKR